VNGLEGLVPPQNNEAEQCVLGSMMIDREVIGDVVLAIGVEDFYVPGHARVFETLIELYERNAPVDLVLVTNELRSRGQLEAVGGVETLVALMESVPSAAHARAYAKLVRGAAERRRLVQAAHEILREAGAETVADVDGLLEKAEQRIYAVARGRGTENVGTMPDLVRAALEKIDALQEGDGPPRGLSTHYTDVDKKLGGLSPGGLYVVAGRPSMGKSTLALNILENMTVRDHVPALLFTLEMSKEQIAENMLCANARIDAHTLMSGHLPDDQYRYLPEAAARLSQAPLFVDDTPGLSLTRLRAKARRLKAQHDVGVIVVDYLQLLTLGHSVESRQIEISLLSGALKQMARELECPVLALSQLNRSVDSRPNRRPMMSDLRESGSIEQDADVVMLLYREDYYAERLEDVAPERRGIAEVIVAKNRNGPTGVVDLRFHPNIMRFDNPQRVDAPPAAPEPAGSSW